MKNILLLTDFSKNSINATHYAHHLFKDDVCTFFILHVKNSASYTTDDLMSTGNESIYNALVKDAKDKLANLVMVLQSDFNSEKFAYKTSVDYDILTDAVNQLIASHSIDLIVMGTNGVTGAKEVVFGSNTINVIRQVNCPTLVIPKGFTFRKPKEILLPLDLMDSLSGAAFANTIKFLKRFGERLHMLRIKPHNENSKEEKKDQEHINYFLKDLDFKYHVVSNVPMNYTVDCYLQTHKIDLTTLLVQKESLFERFFIGSPTTKISNSIREPLLVFHS